MPLLILSLVVGSWMAHWLGQRTRQLAHTDWSVVPELTGTTIAELPLANGQSIALQDTGVPHVLYLFQNDCALCDAQRAHVAELLEAVPAGEALSATAQPAQLSPGYWSDLGSPVVAPVGADSAWLAAHHMGSLPMLLFIDKNGRVSKAIRGSMLSWSDGAVVEELKRAGST